MYFFGIYSLTYTISHNSQGIQLISTLILKYIKYCYEGVIDVRYLSNINTLY